jgi:hypothetical protein
MLRWKQGGARPPALRAAWRPEPRKKAPFPRFPCTPQGLVEPMSINPSTLCRNAKSWDRSCSIGAWPRRGGSRRRSGRAQERRRRAANFGAMRRCGWLQLARKVVAKLAVQAIEARASGEDKFDWWNKLDGDGKEEEKRNSVTGLSLNRRGRGFWDLARRATTRPRAGSREKDVGGETDRLTAHRFYCSNTTSFLCFSFSKLLTIFL